MYHGKRKLKKKGGKLNNCMFHCANKKWAMTIIALAIAISRMAQIPIGPFELEPITIQPSSCVEVIISLYKF